MAPRRGALDSVLIPALLRASGVTVLGARTPDERYDRGAILHRTSIGGTEVVGVSNAFGTVADVVVAAVERFPDAWIVGYEPDDTVARLGTLGATAPGPLRVWLRD